MGTVFGTLAARQAAVAGGADAGAPDRETASPPADKRATDTPDDCYRRGGLQSAYGAYDAAAKSYRKAIALAPRFADAHFQLGVAYGEMRQFEAAIMAMTQAIDLDDDQSAYYYGRGRVYLLAGQEEAAMRDFMEAGFRGHPDARAYLNAAGVSLE
jgi:tetratricopeptide (TPR) repeat protein